MWSCTSRLESRCVACLSFEHPGYRYQWLFRCAWTCSSRGRGGCGAAGMSRIPSTAQGPERSNGGARRVDLGLLLRVAHLQQVAVSVQHLDQADDASSVGGIRVLPRVGEGRFTVRQDGDLGLAFDEGGERVLDILGRAQHGQPVCGQRFRLLATRGGDLRIDAAEVEESPAKSENAQGLAGTAGEQIAARY